MRTLLTTEATAGVWRYTLDLARGLADAGAEPVVAVLGPAVSPERASEAAELPSLRLIETGLPGEAAVSDEQELRAVGAALAGLASRLGADTVHLHVLSLAAEVPWSVPVVAVAHADVGTWWYTVRGSAPPAELAWRMAAAARGLAEADAVVTPTRAFGRMLARVYRPGRSISVIPFGRSRVVTAPCRRRPSVLTAGRLWDEGKNIAILNRAAALLEVPVIAAGRLGASGGNESEFDRLQCVGMLSSAALAARMAEASVFAAPARYEPFGLAVLEAAQAGMALALADIPTFRELWEGAALFFHPDDAGSLADVLSRLLSRPEGAAARASRQAERYTVAAMVEATVALHRPLAGQRAA